MVEHLDCFERMQVLDLLARGLTEEEALTACITSAHESELSPALRDWAEERGLL